MASNKTSDPLVPDSSPPAKRQRTASGYISKTAAAYNSDADSGDDLFEGYVPDTPDASNGKYETQPTQIIDRSAPSNLSSPPDTPPNVVQVPASSPLLENHTASAKEPVRNNNLKSVQIGAPAPRRNLATSMAPAGTIFKAPRGIIQKPPPTNTYIIIDDDDEGPQFAGGGDTSDDDIDARADIKPSTFAPKNSPSSFEPLTAAKTAKSHAKFQSIVSSAVYKGPEKGILLSDSSATTSSISSASKPKTSADLISSSHGSVKNPQRQTRPERAAPVQDISMSSLGSKTERENVSRLRQIFPTASILMCRNAMIQSRGNLDEAAVILGKAREVTVIDDDDEIESPQAKQASLKMPAPQMAPQMKRVLDMPLASLKDRYSSTQGPAAPKSAAVSTPPQKPKKKLVQGRRNPSSPAIPDVSSPLKPRSSPAVSLEEYDTDSGVGSALEEAEDPELDERVVKFLNTCMVEELIELTNAKKPSADLMIAARPFRSLDAARAVSTPSTTKAGKKSTRAPIGDKIVDTAINMFSGYQAIDALVQRCEEVGKPLFEEMEKWGFDVFGAAKDGELEMTSLDADTPSQRDSGIGSPSSGAASLNGDVDDDVKIVSSSRKRNNNVKFLKKPALMAENCELKDYQVVGLNWLALMYRQKLSGILADEMGLGKTCQVIALLSHLVETGHNGPHLVICPGSTLENWLREIPKFAPGLKVDVYYGAMKDRPQMAENILARRDEINVIVTTYDLAGRLEDNKFMRRLKPDVCVYDEGHYLKNPNSQRYQGLVKIPARFKLLLTGTPLQNNLQELAALLAFILPQIFQERQEDLSFIFKAKATTRDADHAALLSAQRIARARSMLTPFVLRRKKDQVLKHLPTKTCRVEYCTLHNAQEAIYNGHLDQARERARIRVEGGKVPKSDENNPLMQLRKAAIHPLLFRRHFTDEKIEKMADILRKKEPIHFPASAKRHHLIQEMRSGSDFWLHQWCIDYPCIASFDIPDLEWMNSGKVEALIKLVKEYEKNGDRVLVFSQFALALDILESVLNSALVSFTRIDGSTKIDERQTLIDTFRDDESITAFLLTTKAGGTGINLMYANKVIIFDGSFNPQDDRQAENRAHRVGQVRPVEVVRLVTRGTIEEQIYALGVSKLMLDGRVAGDDDAAQEEAGQKAVAKMFLEGTVVSEKVEESGKKGGEKQKEKGDEVSKVATKHEPPPKRKKSSILDMVTKKGSAEQKERTIVEIDEDGDDDDDDMLV